MNTTIFSSFFMSLYCAFQLMGAFPINQGGVRVDGRFGNAAYLAAFMLISFFFALFMFIKNEGDSLGSKILRYFYVVSGLSSLVIMYYTATRGAFVGLAIGLFVTLAVLALGAKDRKEIRFASITTLIAIFVIVGSLFIFKDSKIVTSNPTLSRLTSISLSDEDAKARLAVWKIAFKGFLDKPIFGWGQENFMYVFSKYYDPSLYNREQWFDRAHNIFLDWLVSGGIFGFLSYVSICLLSIWAVWQRREEDMDFVSKAVFTGLLVGYFGQNFFVFDNIVTSILFYLILAGVSGNILPRSVPPPSVPPKTREVKLKEKESVGQYSASSFLPASIVLFMMVAYFTNANALTSSHLLIKALSRDKDGRWYPEKSLAFFEQALKKDSFGRQEIVEQLTTRATSMAGASANQLDPEIKSKFISLAWAELEKLKTRSPNDARIRTFISSFLIAIGEYEKAAKELEKILELSPKKQVPMFYLADVYANLGKNEDALRMVEQAYELVPERNKKDVAVAVAVSAIRAGDELKAAEMLKKHFDTADLADIRLARAYFAVKNYEKTLSILKTIEKNSSATFEDVISIAYIYQNMGRFQEAINYLNKAANIKPEFKEQAALYIKEIEDMMKKVGK
jgi:O-antigen ligase/tetratricopeptide (TPR) repeat protein